jgi:hypothetical protein
VVQFVIRVTHSRTGDDERGFETTVLVGQASETVSKPEIQVEDYAGFVGAVREPPKIRALLEAPLR